MIQRTARIAFLLLALAGLALHGPLSAPAWPAEPLKFILISGSPGGGWYTQSGIVSQVIRRALPPGSTVTIVPGTGVGNVLSIERDSGHVAYTFTAWAGWAASGTGPFKEPQKNIRTIATLDQNFVNIVARADLPVKSLREVKERRYPLRLVMNRPATDTGGVIARYLFAEYGWGPPEEPYFRDLIKWGGSVRVTSTHGEALDLMRDGHAEMWVIASSFDHPPVVELATARQVKFMGVDEDVLRAMNEKYNLPTLVVPANSFKYMEKPTPFVGVMTVLITNAKQPDEIVYGMTKMLAESKDELCKTIKRLCEYEPKKAWENAGYPLHPGAARYYKEMGYMR